MTEEGDSAQAVMQEPRDGETAAGMKTDPAESQDTDEDFKVPLETKIEFLRALKERDLKSALKLCQLILIFDPDDPEASQFLPLIRKQLRHGQEVEQSSEGEEEEEEEDDDDKDDSNDDDSSHSGTEEDSSQSSSSSSCSSSSPSDDDEEEEKRVNRHKPCPPSNIHT